MSKNFTWVGKEEPLPPAEPKPERIEDQFEVEPESEELPEKPVKATKRGAK